MCLSTILHDVAVDGVVVVFEDVGVSIIVVVFEVVGVSISVVVFEVVGVSNVFNVVICAFVVVVVDDVSPNGASVEMSSCSQTAPSCVGGHSQRKYC